MAIRRTGQQIVDNNSGEAVGRVTGRASDEVSGPSVFARVVVVASEDSPLTRYAFWLADTYETQVFPNGETISVSSETDVVVVGQQTLDGAKRTPRQTVELGRGNCRVLAPSSINSYDGRINRYTVKPVSRDRLLSTVETAVRVATYDGTIAELLELTMQRRSLRDGANAGQDDQCPDIAALSERIDELHRCIDGMSPDVEARYTAVLRQGRRPLAQKTERERK